MPNLYFEEDAMKDMMTSSQEKLKEVVKKYNGRKVKTYVEFGFVDRLITDYASRHRVDLIVMGSKGATGLTEKFIGSHAEKIVRTSTVPVFILKDLYKGGVKNIVFPNMLEVEKHETFISRLKELQNLFDAHLHILWVNTPLNFMNDPDINMRSQAFIDRFQLTNYSFHVFNYSSCEEGIIEFTRMIDGDIIAMATHGRRGLSHFFNGSLTEEVVNHVQCPIWTCVMQENNVLVNGNN